MNPASSGYHGINAPESIRLQVPIIWSRTNRDDSGPAFVTPADHIDWLELPDYAQSFAANFHQSFAALIDNQGGRQA